MTDNLRFSFVEKFHNQNAERECESAIMIASWPINIIHKFILHAIR